MFDPRYAVTSSSDDHTSENQEVLCSTWFIHQNNTVY